MEPKVLRNACNGFCEVFRESVLHESFGRSLQISQMSCSGSRRGVGPGGVGREAKSAVEQWQPGRRS
jgi:hypothetical protein